MTAHISNLSGTRSVSIRANAVMLEGDLHVPDEPAGFVIFAHGSGSGRLSPRNQFVARVLQEVGLGTLLVDLLTREEEIREQYSGALRFNIPMLAERLVSIHAWLTDALPTVPTVGFFGASTGAGAALVAAAALGDAVAAVVSRGGRPDLAGDVLPDVKAPTLLLVGSLDHPVIELNEMALEDLRCEKQLRLVPGASHLFEEPGKLAEVADHAAKWFRQHL